VISTVNILPQPKADSSSYQRQKQMTCCKSCDERWSHQG